MTLAIWRTNRFKKDYKIMLKRRKNIDKLMFVVKTLAQQETLPIRYCDHALVGNYNGSRECHIEPDWHINLYANHRCYSLGVNGSSF